MLKCIWQTFFICSIKSPQCTDKCSKEYFSMANFLPRALMYQKCQISLPVSPSEKQISPTLSYFLIINALLYHFLANWLAHNKKMTEKSVFRGAWSPEMTLQSFQVSCFLSRGFVPHRKLNLTHLVSQNTGKENRYRNFFFAGISVHLGDLVEQIKKKSVIYTFNPDCVAAERASRPSSNNY